MEFTVNSESEMVKLGERIARRITVPAQVELIGDIGVGKTTLVKGMAKGFGVGDDVTSPSFTVNKRYLGNGGVIVSHYDFYRLDDAGVMRAEMEESTDDEKSVVIVEWADSVGEVLDKERVKIRIDYSDDEARIVRVEGTEL